MYQAEKNICRKGVEKIFFCLNELDVVCVIVFYDSRDLALILHTDRSLGHNVSSVVRKSCIINDLIDHYFL